MFAIAKECQFGRRLYVTRILKGGLSIDNARSDPDARHDFGKAVARKFKTREAADKARALMFDVGGFDDYHVVVID